MGQRVCKRCHLPGHYQKKCKAKISNKVWDEVVGTTEAATEDVSKIVDEDLDAMVLQQRMGSLGSHEDTTLGKCLFLSYCEP